MDNTIAKDIRKLEDIKIEECGICHLSVELHTCKDKSVINKFLGGMCNIDRVKNSLDALESNFSI